MSGKGTRKAITALLLLGLLSACVSQAAREELAQEYYNLGNAFYEIRSYDRAIDYYTLAISHDPGLLNAHYNLSLALIKQGRGDKAEKTKHIRGNNKWHSTIILMKRSIKCRVLRKCGSIRPKIEWIAPMSLERTALKTRFIEKAYEKK